ncbi:hypothetical protein [Mycobacterium sherrisii]|uniref:Uncharacterized protein n=1 Tax=Mycobacterium sherrisii TaxID=243061 RepID=A0A1E3SXD7_9MYCO|nr:hypothetical protein [Mycobacterium sherrisii]MCV7029606.1 hypothetical protein [Mycobacterium sherrisii]MEC4763917.1 hypothetical protein [Mycobacterium sherrisii]ODR06824.1 hypothetical protein BHQ21_10500 [Mycobacterium sherrisii]ORW83580.1 hypothetical protein AWC25_25595 [Mycobacterium sherrisii]
MTGKHRAKAEKSEEDIDPDPNVAGSRAGSDKDGSYVGRASSDDDFGSGETGAEARSQDG